jgi:tetratricopeptide (TPR) repeat protein
LARALVQRAGAPDVAVQRSLARLLPEFGSPPAGDDEAETARLLAALESVLSAAAAAGVAIVVVDDLHFADRASTEALCHLASLQGGPTWIFAARPADGPAPMHDAIEPLLASGQVQRIELTPLSAAQIAELVDSLGVPGWHGPSLAPRLVRHTGGNPQFVLETLKAMPLDARQGDDPERLPVAPTVTLLVGRRISKLSADAVRIARCAALAGQDFSAELATALLGVRPLDLADAWAELESAQVLREQAFAHDLIREAALASVPLALARQLHGQIAEFLAGHDGAPARIAEHWLASSRPQAAVPHLQEAGRRAIRALRKTEAAQAYERAAELLEQAGDRAAAFDVLHTFFEQALPQWDASSRRLMDRLIVLAETPRQHALAGCRHAVQLARSGDFDASGAAAAAALALVDAHAEPALAATLMSFRVASLLQHGQFDEAVQTMYRAVALAETAGDEETLFTTVGTLASALDWAHRDVEAQPQHARALSLAQRGGQPENIIAASVNLASNALSLGHLADADRALGLAERTAVVHDLTIGDEWPAAVAIRARIALDLGDFVRAVRAAEDALALYERRMPHSLIGVQNMVTTLWMRLGQWARAHRSAQQALALRDGAAARYAVLASKLAAEVEAAVEGAAGRLQALDEVKATLAASDTLVVSQIDLSRCRWLEPRDAHVLALRLRDQARAAAVRPSELDAEVMCARAALRAGDRVAASAHARAALSLFSAVEPYALYRAEVWLAAAQALESVDAPRARRVLEEAQQWVKATAAGRVPPEFRDSFLHRNPVNRELLALAAALPR